MRIGFRHCLLAGCLLLAEAAATGVMCLAGQPGVGSEPTGGNAPPPPWLRTQVLDSPSLYQGSAWLLWAMGQRQPCLPLTGLQMVRLGLCMNIRACGQC